MKLTHVRLLVNDFDACFRFYKNVMGFQVQWGDEASGYAEFRGRGDVDSREREISEISRSLERPPSTTPTRSRSDMGQGTSRSFRR